jgi:hypothetical protein
MKFVVSSQLVRELDFEQPNLFLLLGYAFIL